MNRTRNRTTKQFLNDIHGDDKINFRLIKKDYPPLKHNAPYDEKTIDYLTEHNSKGYNVYYVVNGGGDKDESINLINSVFIDFDCPKEMKQHATMDKVDAYKREQMDKINQFKYKPSYIVETRNGLHVYWLVNKDATVEQFKIAQQRLIAYFDSDISIKNPSRVMRLPEYYWTKDMSQKYMVKIKECNINRYDYKPYWNVNTLLDNFLKVQIFVIHRSHIP
ncbi:MAG: DNA-primase RepB domain-containing protein, partial [Bacillota bacterium]|nr:DNA-primase RepB domain-containing protein [Bacillota bacterium]